MAFKGLAKILMASRELAQNLPVHHKSKIVQAPVLQGLIVKFGLRTKELTKYYCINKGSTK